VINERSIVCQSKSFKDLTIGPFRVLKRFNDINHTIVSLGYHKIQNIHYNRLRKYRARENLGAPILNTNSGSSTSCQSIPVSNDINLDLVLFSQLLLGVRSSSPVVGNSGDSIDSSDTDDDLTINSVEEDVDAGDDHEIENERNSDDGNEEENFIIFYFFYLSVESVFSLKAGENVAASSLTVRTHSLTNS
jgi:hypothetical protein